VIGLLLAAALLGAGSPPPTAPPDIPPLRPRPTPPPAVAPARTLARYAEALAATHTPLVLSFEYSIDQAGGHDIQQTHRVFRSGNSERDELLSVDGKRVEPPSIHIFLGRRNRYAIESLAPRPEAYTFHYVASVRDGKHVDAVFETTPLSPAPATVQRVTIDGITFLPTTIRFVTSAHSGSGSVSFGRVQKYWMATAATAAATYAKSSTVEHLAFYRYRFPIALAPSTFSTPRPLPSFRPTPY
jgi:hypothetical protein